MPNIKRANRRERKRNSKRRDETMRGKRSVFEIAKAVHKRARDSEAKRLKTEPRAKR